MNTTHFEGIYPVLSLPFDAKRDIDYESLRDLVEFCIEKGAHGIMMFGIASEFYKITDEESREVIKAIVTSIRKRVPFVVGVGKLSTATTVMQARFCVDNAVDGLIVLPPYFMPISRQKLLEHYINIARSVTLPIIIQDAPQMSGVNMDVDFFKTLVSDAPNIEYAKIETPFSGPKISEVLAATDGKVRVFDGNGGLHFYEHLLRGACGLMPGCSVIETFVGIYDCFRRNEKDQALAMYRTLLPYVNIQCQAGELYILCEKTMLKHRGVIKSATSREPWLTLDTVTEDLLIQHLRGLNVP